MKKAALTGLAALATVGCASMSNHANYHPNQHTRVVHAQDEAINRCPGEYAPQFRVTKRRGEGGPVIDSYIETRDCPTNSVTIPLQNNDTYCVTDRQCYHTTLRNPCREGELAASNGDGLFTCTTQPHVLLQPHGQYGARHSQRRHAQPRGMYFEYHKREFEHTTHPPQHHPRNKSQGVDPRLRNRQNNYRDESPRRVNPRTRRSRGR